MRNLVFLVLALSSLASHAQHWQWVNHLTGGGGSHYVFDAEMGNDPNEIFFCGRYRATATFHGQNGFDVVNPPHAGSRDIFFAKTDSLGQFQWVQTIGGTDTDIAYGITVDEFDNVYVTGEFNLSFSFEGFPVSSNGGGDVFVAKFDPVGTCLWVRTMGGAGYDTGNKIVCDKNGSIYAGGSQGGTFYYDSDSLVHDGYYVAKFDYDGNIIWVKGPENVTSSASTLTALKFYDGEIYFGGGFTGNIKIGTIQCISNGTWNDVFFAKLDTAGTAQWAHHAGSPTYDFCNDIAVNDSFVYVVGTYSGTINFDTISVTCNQSVPGSTGALHSRDGFIAKYDSTGTCYWVTEHKSLMADEENSVFINSKGEIIVAGSYLQSPDPNLSTSVGELRVSAYSSEGDLNWTITAVGSHIGVGFTVCGDPMDNVYFGGAVKDTYTFDAFSIPAGSSVYSGIMAKILPPLNTGYNQSLQSCVVDTLYYTVDATGGPLIYDWFYGPQQLITEAGDSLVLLFDPLLDDSVSCIVSNGMESDTVVFFAPGFNFPVVDLGSDLSTCETTIELNAGADGEYYDWGSGNVLYDSTLTASISGTYIVTVTNADQCETTDSVTISFVDCSGISESALEPLVIFSHGHITISLEEMAFYYVIHDLSGRIILNDHAVDKCEISTQSFAPGVYLLSLSNTRTQEPYVTRFVVAD